METQCLVTGMAINTVCGDNLDAFFSEALQGRSGVQGWKFFETQNAYCKVGGDLSGYDIEKKFAKLEPALPTGVSARAKKLLGKIPWSIRVSVMLILDLLKHSNLQETDLSDVGIIVCGTNLNLNYHDQTFDTFKSEPDFIDPLFALSDLDTSHAGVLSEILQSKNFAYTVGAACASGSVGIQQALNEIKLGRVKKVIVIAPSFDYSPLYLHGLAMMGAVSIDSFNQNPSEASRPFDIRREGFVPSHGGGAILIESRESACQRHATTFAEIVGVDLSSSAHSLATPSVESYVQGMERLLERARVRQEEVDFISAHATSTPQGDLAEIQAIKAYFKDHAKNLKINAAKSLIGHTTSASAIVELVLGILQMNRGQIHRSINIDKLDPAIDLDVNAQENSKLDIRYFLKNAFGFGGLNSFILVKNTRELL